MPNPFEHTRTVAFELSSLCNLAPFHPLCPVHRNYEGMFPVVRETLPHSIISKVVDDLVKYQYQGEINFHQYNEPLCDPRLLGLIQEIRFALPKAGLVLITNGTLLTKELVGELAQAGLTEIKITVYGAPPDRAKLAEWERSVHGFLPIDLMQSPGLDDRLMYYTRPPIPFDRPCYQPLCDVTVTCRGELALCCLDWQRIYNLGKLSKAPLHELLLSEPVQSLYGELSKNQRRLGLCQRCASTRGG